MNRKHHHIDKLGRYEHFPDPITIALATAAGATAAEAAALGATTAAVVSAAGTGVAGLGAIQAGRAQAAQAQTQASLAEFNRKIAEREAQAIEQQAEFRQRRQAEAGERIQSALLARGGISGAVPGVGAPLMIEAEQAAELELENLLLGREGQVGTSRARTQAGIQRTQARVFRARGRAARQASFFQAGTPLLAGFGFGLTR